jgi:DNA polymerase
MRRVVLADETDFDGFRKAARELALGGAHPSAVVFAVGDAPGDLFAGDEAAPAPAPTGELRVPRHFVELAERVICHSSPDRFTLLYRILYRLRRTPKLLDVAIDPDVHAAARLAKAVDRDCHKMKAFVRFRELATEAGPEFVAWFEPDHYIEERVAPFFMRRFAPMRFTILTPRRSIRWDTATLAFGPGADKSAIPAEDAAEALWLTYFANIFNPARLKVKAMTAEMPKKYWRNLPEAALIPDLIAEAEQRTEHMIAKAPTEPPVRHRRAAAHAAAPAASTEAPLDAPLAPDTLEALHRAAESCRRCPLWRDATQVVFGEGPSTADVMVVGEQPGDREDLVGRPFVGPAGQVFDEASAAAGLDRTRLYVTNAVKHFKFEPRGKRRIHKKPNAGEVEACRWWLDHEVGLLKPALIVAMGGTALQAVLRRPAKITELRGRFLDGEDGVPVFATVHPSYILRLPDPLLREAERRRFEDDLGAVAGWLKARAA